MPAPQPPTLDELKQRYFDLSNPTFDETTELTLHVDGIPYFSRVADLLEKTAANDVIMIAGWTFDPTIDLRNRGALDPNRQLVEDLLGIKERAGVDVLVVLNGALYERYIGGTPFEASFVTLRAFQSRVPPGLSGLPPLRDAALFDWSGESLTGSHHQKAVVVGHGGDVTTFVGGIDMVPNRLDQAPHDTLKHPRDQKRWGWHDIAIELHGAATKAVWEIVAARWNEALTLPARTYWVRTGGTVPSSFTYKPPAALLAPTYPSMVPAVAAPGTSIQVLRSRWDFKVPNTPFAGGQPWTIGPPGPLHEVYETLSHAIDNAQTYIYIEDQFLQDSPVLYKRNTDFSLLPHLREAVNRDVKLIMLGSGKGDPDDIGSGVLKNQELPDHVVNADYVGFGLKRDLIDLLPSTKQANIAIWRLDDCTLHAKLMIIDDRFLAVGSANIQSRSMMGVDQELHVAVVATDDTVKDWRIQLWSEHLRITASLPELADLDLALSMWRTAWRQGGSPGMWFTSNNPVGFAPAEFKRAYVGPGTAP